MIYNINCTKIDNFLSIPDLMFEASKTAYFHCSSTGHFGRNSYITELSLLYESKNHSQTLLQWVAENDSDEYEMLIAFSDALSRFDTIIGFNSTSFHIPYLENKTKSYDLPSLFTGKQHIDLLKSIKPIGTHLHISTKLDDLRIFFQIPDTCSEIECIAHSTGLFVYDRLFSGDFTVNSVKRIDDEVLFLCEMDYTLPAVLRIPDKEFYLIAENKQLKIKTKLIDEKLKLFYPNYKDYYYLPEEGMAIHKSLAATVSKDKKIKATPQNCFSYIPYTKQIERNMAALKKYLTSLLKHYTES